MKYTFYNLILFFLTVNVKAQNIIYESNETIRDDTKILDAWNRTMDNPSRRYPGFERRSVHNHSENNIRISLKAGVCYLPLGEWSNSAWNSFPNSNKNEPSYSGSFSIHYLFDEYHSISLGVGITRASATASDMFSNVSWTFSGYPINFTYFYYFTETNSGLRSYLGLGFIYVFSSLEVDVSGSPERWSPIKLDETGYGVDGTLGMNINLSKKFTFDLSLSLKYIDGSAFADRKYNSIDFSGIYLLAGIIYNF